MHFFALSDVTDRVSGGGAAVVVVVSAAVTFACSCTALWAERHPGEGSRPYWSWQAKECKLEEVDAAGFCGAMEGRKGLLLVGELRGSACLV